MSKLIGDDVTVEDIDAIINDLLGHMTLVAGNIQMMKREREKKIDEAIRNQNKKWKRYCQEK